MIRNRRWDWVRLDLVQLVGRVDLRVRGVAHLSHRVKAPLAIGQLTVIRVYAITLTDAMVVW